jgi:hypothetical protein
MTVVEPKVIRMGLNTIWSEPIKITTANPLRLRPIMPRIPRCRN